MIKIAICDDERKDRDRIYRLVQEYGKLMIKEYEIERYEAGEQLLSSGSLPDILFLDIMMGEKDGIQIGSDIKRQGENTLIIYTTNLKAKMAVALNRIHAFGYLEKPVEEEEFFNIMDDAIERIDKRVRADVVTFLSENKTLIELVASDIYYFEYCERKVKIVTKKESFFCKEKISNIADRMDSYGFVMSHQSFVVNLYHIERITPQSLVMKDGAAVFLAQKRAANIRKRLMQIAREAIIDRKSEYEFT